MEESINDAPIENVYAKLNDEWRHFPDIIYEDIKGFIKLAWIRGIDEGRRREKQLNALV